MKEAIKAIKNYIEFAKREHAADLSERDSARPDIMSYYIGIVNAGRFNIEHETFQALEAIIAEGKPCSLCYEREFEGMICPKCEKNNDVEPENQTLLDYLEFNIPITMEEINDVTPHIARAFRYISDYLEQK